MLRGAVHKTCLKRRGEEGIGPKIEAILHDHGITTFRQIAELDETQVDALGEALGSFRGRIVRDDWVGAARQMVGVTAGR